MRTRDALSARFCLGFLVFLFATPVALRAGAADLPLVSAAAQQDWQQVRALLAEGADVNERRADGVTALLWAAHWNHVETVEALLAAGANPNAVTDRGVTPLMRASENASVAVAEALLAAGANPDAAQTSGLTALMIAADTGDRDVVRALLARGADVNAVTPSTGATALMWAVEAPHPAVVHILLESAADVSVSSKKGFTPLLLAARNGDVELARLLIAAGADVNEPGSDGTHALPLAIISGHDAFAMFLLEQGADPRGTIDGVPALHAASGDVTTWLVDWYREHGGRRAVDAGGRGIRGLSPERRLPLVAALLARGADPNSRIDKSAVVLSYIGTTRYGVFEQNSVGTGDVRGATPLWVAAKSSNGGGLQGEQGPPSQYRYDSSADIIRALVAAGADPNLTTDDGTTALMMAAGLGVRSHQPLMPRGRPSPPAEAAVRALVEAGADINATNNGDFTALHGATFRGLNEVIQYLVEQGADIDARDYRGRTAYRMAEGAKQSFQYQAFPETAEFLEQLGANPRLGIPGTIHERADREALAETVGGPDSR